MSFEAGDISRFFRLTTFKKKKYWKNLFISNIISIFAVENLKHKNMLYSFIAGICVVAAIGFALFLIEIKNAKEVDPKEPFLRGDLVE